MHRHLKIVALVGCAAALAACRNDGGAQVLSQADSSVTRVNAAAIKTSRVLGFRCAAVEGSHVLTAQIDTASNDVLVARIPSSLIANPTSGEASASLTCNEHATLMTSALAAAKTANLPALDWWVVADASNRLITLTFDQSRFAILAHPAGSVDDMASQLGALGFRNDARVDPVTIQGRRKYLTHLGVTLLARAGGGESAQVEVIGGGANGSQNPSGAPDAGTSAVVPSSQAEAPASTVADSGSCRHLENLPSTSSDGSLLSLVSANGATLKWDVVVPPGHSWVLRVDGRYEICGSGRNQRVEYTFVGSGSGPLPPKQDRQIALVVRDASGMEVPGLGKSETQCVGSDCEPYNRAISLPN